MGVSSGASSGMPPLAPGFSAAWSASWRSLRRGTRCVSPCQRRSRSTPARVRACLLRASLRAQVAAAPSTPGGGGCWQLQRGPNTAGAPVGQHELTTIAPSPDVRAGGARSRGHVRQGGQVGRSRQAGEQVSARKDAEAGRLFGVRRLRRSRSPPWWVPGARAPAEAIREAAADGRVSADTAARMRARMPCTMAGQRADTQLPACVHECLAGWQPCVSLSVGMLSRRLQPVCVVALYGTSAGAPSACRPRD